MDARGVTLAGIAAGGLAWAAVRAVRVRTRADLTGAAALVTGGSRGLGLLIARELARAGCRVAICARDGAELERAAAWLAGDPGVPGDVVTVRGDVGDETRARAVVEEAATRLGGLDVVVNNAGFMQVGPYERQSAADMRAAMDVMFWGPYHVTDAALPYLERSGRAHLVNISSIGGRISVPHLLPYSCAKHAVAAFSEGAGAELAARGIRTTTVMPGLMRTGSQLNAAFTGDARREYAWFGLLASLPLLSMDAERAARRIVAAAREGRPALILTPAAHLGIAGHGVAPGLTARALALTARLLPGPEGSTPDAEPVRGEAAHREIDAPAYSVLTRLGLDAADRFNQHDAD